MARETREHPYANVIIAIKNNLVADDHIYLSSTRFESYRDAIMYALDYILELPKKTSKNYKKFVTLAKQQKYTDAIHTYCDGTNGKMWIKVDFDMLYDFGNPTDTEVIERLKNLK